MKRLVLLFLFVCISFSSSVYADKESVLINAFNEIKGTLIEAQKCKKMMEKEQRQEGWRSLGDCRITNYCPVCNDPEYSYESLSGKELKNGHAACNWLDVGTVIKVNGREYEIVDTCGTEAIDLFVDSYECWCDDNYYGKVKIRR